LESDKENLHIIP